MCDNSVVASVGRGVGGGGGGGVLPHSSCLE